MKLPIPHSRTINPKKARYRLQMVRSRLHRYGVIALEDIPSGRRVIEYTGKKLNREQASKIKPPNDIYLVGLSSKWVLDGRRGGSGAQFVNHSCDPNLKWRQVKNGVIFFSRRQIRAGEELTVNYRYPVELVRVPCNCGAAKCRGTLRYILR